MCDSIYQLRGFANTRKHITRNIAQINMVSGTTKTDYSSENCNIA